MHRVWKQYWKSSPRIFNLLKEVQRLWNSTHLFCSCPHQCHLWSLKLNKSYSEKKSYLKPQPLGNWEQCCQPWQWMGSGAPQEEVSFHLVDLSSKQKEGTTPGPRCPGYAQAQLGCNWQEWSQGSCSTPARVRDDASTLLRRPNGKAASARLWYLPEVLTQLKDEWMHPEEETSASWHQKSCRCTAGVVHSQGCVPIWGGRKGKRDDGSHKSSVISRMGPDMLVRRGNSVAVARAVHRKMWVSPNTSGAT